MVKCLHSKTNNKTAAFLKGVTLPYIDWPKLLAGYYYPLGSLGYSLNGMTVKREIVPNNGQTKKERPLSLRRVLQKS
jgi:hypothetical protein